MDVKPISSTNSNPSFNGFLNKSVVKYVNAAVKNQCDFYVKSANEAKEKVDTEKLTEVRDLGAKVLSKLAKFMSKTHSKTELVFDNLSSSVYPELRNPVTSSKISIIGTNKNSHFYSGSIFLKNSSIYMDFKPAAKSDKNDLIKLYNVADELGNINPKSVDRTFLLNADIRLKSYTEKYGATVIGTFRAKSKAKKIDKYAKEIGEEQVERIRVNEYLKSAIEQKQRETENAQALKDIEKWNKETAKSILKKES